VFYAITPDIPVETLKKKYADNSLFMDLRGMSVHYRDEKLTDTPNIIVLIHGTSSSLHTWDEWSKILISNGYRVIRLDLPGFGLTGPNPAKNYTRVYYADFLHAFLSKLDIPKFHMAGNSLGGHITWEYAFKYPETLKSITLIDSAGFDMPMPTLFWLLKQPILNIITKYVTPYALFKRGVSEVYADQSKISDELILRYYELALREGNRNAFADFLSQTVYQNRNAETTEKISSIKLPTLIMWGEEDRWINVDKARRFNEIIKGSTLKIYQNVGHVPMEEIPNLTATDLLNFLKNI